MQRFERAAAAAMSQQERLSRSRTMPSYEASAEGFLVDLRVRASPQAPMSPAAPRQHARGRELSALRARHAAASAPHCAFMLLHNFRVHAHALARLTSSSGRETFCELRAVKAAPSRAVGVAGAHARPRFPMTRVPGAAL